MVPDLAKIANKTHKLALIFGGISFALILVFGALTQMFKDSAASKSQPRSLGRLHYKYAPNKETPWVDVAADRDTLEAWRGLFIVGHGHHRTTEQIAHDYGELLHTGKLLTVKPNTLVRVVKQEGDSDCYVTILSAENREQSGWVDCNEITN